MAFQRIRPPRTLGGALFLCISGLGAGFASGREISFFFTQTQKASHLGALLCAALYGAFIGLCTHFARRTGASSFPQIFRRSLGVYAGKAIGVLHFAALLLMGWLSLCFAGQAAALLLPIKHAAAVGAAFAVLFALLIAKNEGKTALLGLGFGGILLLYLLLLLLFGRLPPESQLYVHTRLKLKNSPSAALILGALYACRCMMLTASAAVSLSDCGRPRRMGLLCGIGMLALLECANGALLRQDVQLLALKQPLSAMFAQFGKAGYSFAASTIYTSAVFSLGCALLSIRRIAWKKRRNGC